MKKIHTIVFACIVLFSAATAMAQEQYKLKFHDFNELVVADDINVDYICDPSKAGEVEFEAPKHLVSLIVFEPSKTKLTIKLSDKNVEYPKVPTVKVYSSYLTNLKNDGDSLVQVLSIADGPKFSCRVIGNGKISIHNIKANEISATILTGKGAIAINGECKVASLNVTGSGQINAEGLKALEVKATASSGSIVCHAVEKLNAGGLSGKIQFRGTPEVKKQFLSNVKIISIEE